MLVYAAEGKNFIISDNFYDRHESIDYIEELNMKSELFEHRLINYDEYKFLLDGKFIDDGDFWIEGCGVSDGESFERIESFYRFRLIYVDWHKLIKDYTITDNSIIINRDLKNELTYDEAIELENMLRMARIDYQEHQEFKRLARIDEIKQIMEGLYKNIAELAEELDGLK